MVLDEQFNEVAVRGFTASDAEGLKTLARSAIRERGDILQWMQHPLGFYHVLLYKQGLVSLRLHYWPAKHRPLSSAVTPYHDHVWSLQSCVLAGKLENVVLSLKQENEGPYAVAVIQQVGSVDSVVPTPERVSILSADASPYSVGDCYTIPPRVFHCTRVSENVATLTIVRAEVVASAGPRTLVPAGYSGQAPSRVYLHDSEAAILLQQVETILSEAQA